MVFAFAEDQVPLGGGQLRRYEDVIAEGGEEFIQGWGASGLENWKRVYLKGRSWLVYVNGSGIWRNITDLVVELSCW